MPPPGIVTGFAAEAAIARRSGLPVACSGGQFARSRSAAEALLAQGVGGLVSFGIAGGLQPGLRPGTVVIGAAVVTATAALPTTADWRDRLHRDVPGSVVGPVFGADDVVADKSRKHQLHARTRAIAVDLESAAVAEICTRAGLPFAILRAIADPAESDLPPAALIGLRADGGIAIGPVLTSVLRTPRQIPALMRLTADVRQALNALAVALPALTGRPGGL